MADKYCIECRWGGGGERMPPELCNRPNGGMVRDLVSGQVRSERPLPLCRSERRPISWIAHAMGVDRCGPGGRYYEFVEATRPENRPRPPQDWE